MTVTAPIRKTDDVLSALRDGYLLVVEPSQAFLTDGQFSQGSNRPNLPVPMTVANASVAVPFDVQGLPEVRELTKDEIKNGGCRPLHHHRKPKVYTLKG